MKFSHPQKNSIVLLGFLILVIFMVLICAGILFRSVLPQNSQITKPSPELLTKAIVMPHHDLLIDQFPTFYQSFSLKDRQQIKQIIFLSPNHFQTQETIIKTRANNFNVVAHGSPTQSVSTSLHINPFLLQSLLSTNIVSIDDIALEKDHGVFLHLPFLAQAFPNATLTPLLLTRNISQAPLDKVVSLLAAEMKNGETLLFISSDFSHYLSYDEAEKKDQETLSIIQNGQAEQVLRLGDDHTDCPACLYITMKVLAQEKYHPPTVLFHGNSAQYVVSSSSTPSTSYFILRW